MSIRFRGIASTRKSVDEGREGQKFGAVDRLPCHRSNTTKTIQLARTPTNDQRLESFKSLGVFVHYISDLTSPYG